MSRRQLQFWQNYNYFVSGQPDAPQRVGVLTQTHEVEISTPPGNIAETVSYTDNNQNYQMAHGIVTAIVTAITTTTWEERQLLHVDQNGNAQEGGAMGAVGDGGAYDTFVDSFGRLCVAAPRESYFTGGGSGLSLTPNELQHAAEFLGGYCHGGAMPVDTDLMNLSLGPTASPDQNSSVTSVSYESPTSGGFQDISENSPPLTGSPGSQTTSSPRTPEELPELNIFGCQYCDMDPLEVSKALEPSDPPSTELVSAIKLIPVRLLCEKAGVPADEYDNLLNRESSALYDTLERQRNGDLGYNQYDRTSYDPSYSRGFYGPSNISPRSSGVTNNSPNNSVGDSTLVNFSSGNYSSSSNNFGTNNQTGDNMDNYDLATNRMKNRAKNLVNNKPKTSQNNNPSTNNLSNNDVNNTRNTNTFTNNSSGRSSIATYLLNSLNLIKKDIRTNLGNSTMVTNCLENFYVGDELPGESICDDFVMDNNINNNDRDNHNNLPNNRPGSGNLGNNNSPNFLGLSPANAVVGINNMSNNNLPGYINLSNNNTNGHIIGNVNSDICRPGNYNLDNLGLGGCIQCDDLLGNNNVISNNSSGDSSLGGNNLGGNNSPSSSNSGSNILGNLNLGNNSFDNLGDVGLGGCDCVVCSNLGSNNGLGMNNFGNNGNCGNLGTNNGLGMNNFGNNGNSGNMNLVNNRPVNNNLGIGDGSRRNNNDLINNHLRYNLFNDIKQGPTMNVEFGNPPREFSINEYLVRRAEEFALGPDVDRAREELYRHAGPRFPYSRDYRGYWG